MIMPSMWHMLWIKNPKSHRKDGNDLHVFRKQKEVIDFLLRELEKKGDKYDYEYRS